MNYAGAQQIAAEVVYEADFFRYLGPIKEPEHVPTLDNKLRHEKAAIGVYAIVRMQDGTFRCEYVDAPTVQPFGRKVSAPYRADLALTYECNNECELTICGDGILQQPNGQGQNEECDDGNNVDGDGCNANCFIE